MLPTRKNQSISTSSSRQGSRDKCVSMTKTTARQMIRRATPRPIIRTTFLVSTRNIEILLLVEGHPYFGYSTTCPNASFGFALERADLGWAHLTEATFHEAKLERTRLENTILSDKNHIGPRLANIYWGYVNLSRVKWSSISMLRCEYEARQKERNGQRKE